jgi:hypothetical protein
VTLARRGRARYERGMRRAPSCSRAVRSSLLLPLLLLGAACGGEPPGFDTPESALHDPAADVYLVSNIHGAPTAKDGNGYISRLRPDGTGERRWIQGGRGGVTLHAPKGMAIVGDVLWVADIDVLRRFDRTSGKPLGEVALPGATFANDVTAGPDGAVYCTDTGLTPEFQASGTDAIWRVAADGTAAPLVRGPELGQPNGLVAQPNGLYVVGWASGAFYQVDYAGRRSELVKAPQAQLDGLVRVEPEDGPPYWLCTSWAGACVYRFDRTGGCTPLPHRLEQPADCGLDAARRRLLVPLFGANRLEIVPL